MFLTFFQNSQITEVDLEEARGAPPFLFLQSLIFCDNFEELQTVLIEVKLIIINNAPLTYVYPNTIKTYLTPNHLLFARLYFNTTLTVVRTLTVL